jgi:low temperature requirement protein LtrA
LTRPAAKNDARALSPPAAAPGPGQGREAPVAARRDGGRPTARRPPRLRTLQDPEERHASALELFFDLVFAVAVAELGQTLSHHPSASGFLHFAALFAPVWGAGVGYTFYADRFDTDDLVFRLGMLSAMLAVTWLAVEILHAFTMRGGVAFAGAYVTARGILIALYLRADHHEPRARPLTRRFLAAFIAGAAL